MTIMFSVLRCSKNTESTLCECMRCLELPLCKCRHWWDFRIDASVVELHRWKGFLPANNNCGRRERKRQTCGWKTRQFNCTPDSDTRTMFCQVSGKACPARNGMYGWQDCQAANTVYYVKILSKCSHPMHHCVSHTEHPEDALLLL